MAKFCGNCGAKMSDDEKVCNQCGKQVEEISINNSRMEKGNLEKKKKIKLFILFIILVGIAIEGVNIISGFMGYKGLLRKVMKAYEEYDIDTLVSLSSDVYYYGEEDYVEEYFKNSVGEDLDLFEETVGHNYKLTYDVNEIYSMSNRKQDELLSNIESKYPDFDVTVIKDLMVAEITVTAKQGSKSENIDLNITISKEKDSWKVLYID